MSVCLPVCATPSNTNRRWTNGVLLLVHRLWLWLNSKTLVQSLVFAEIDSVAGSETYFTPHTKNGTDQNKNCLHSKINCINVFFSCQRDWHVYFYSNVLKLDAHAHPTKSSNIFEIEIYQIHSVRGKFILVTTLSKNSLVMSFNVRQQK